MPHSDSSDRRQPPPRKSTGAARGGSSGRLPQGRQSARPQDREERVYDPRREARRQLSRVPLPDEVQVGDLDREARRELSGLSRETADLVARHLVMAGRLMDGEPEQALAHARAARALGGRIAMVREANGLVAYAAGEWSEALSELRTARRISGAPDHLPVMADCERALGRPDRALLISEDPQLPSLNAAARVEMLIVASGARRDLGQPEAAAVSLQVAALEGPLRPWTARLRYAYADALVDCGREEEARMWFARAAEIDEDGETDAEERLLELDGITFEDADDPAVAGIVEISTEDSTEDSTEPDMGSALGSPAESGPESKDLAEATHRDAPPAAQKPSDSTNGVDHPAAKAPALLPAASEEPFPSSQSLFRSGVSPVEPEVEAPVLVRPPVVAPAFVGPPIMDTEETPTAHALPGDEQEQQEEGEPGDLTLFD